jgi:phage shock protein A
MLMDEIVTLKMEKDKLERELARKDAHLLDAKSSVDKSSVALTNAETKIQTLKAQVCH